MYRTTFVGFCFCFFSLKHFTPTVPGMCKWKPVKMCLPCSSLFFFYLSLSHKTISELLVGFEWHLTFWNVTKIFTLLQFHLNSDNKIRYFTWRHFWNCVCHSSVMCGKLTLCTSEWTGQTNWTRFLCRILFSICVTGFEITDWAGFFMFCQLMAWAQWEWIHCCSRVHLFYAVCNIVKM
jgi:hypothetical protein